MAHEVAFAMMISKFIVQIAPTIDGLVRIRMFWVKDAQAKKNYSGTLEMTPESWEAFRSRFPDAIVEEVRWFEGIG